MSQVKSYEHATKVLHQLFDAMSTGEETPLQPHDQYFILKITGRMVSGIEVRSDFLEEQAKIQPTMALTVRIASLRMLPELVVASRGMLPWAPHK